MTRNSLRPRYTIYDRDGNKVARISVRHSGHFLHSDDVNSDFYTAVPSHMTSVDSLDEVEVANTQTEPLRQSLARLDYESVKSKSNDNWTYECPLFRQSVDKLDSFTVEEGFDADELENDIKDIVFNWTPEKIENIVEEYAKNTSYGNVLAVLLNEFSEEEMDNVKRTQWIFSPRGDSKDADPHLYTSGLAYYAMKEYLPQWALEDIAHQIGLDGHTQIQMYNIIQFERKLSDVHDEFNWSNDKELYQYISDKYRTKFTAEELEAVETDVANRIEENNDDYERLVQEYRQEWASHLGGEKARNDTSWYNYNQDIEGPEFRAPIVSYAFIYTLEQFTEEVFDELCEDAQDGDVSVMSEEVITRPVDSLPSPETDFTLPENPMDTNYQLVTYREWWECENVPPLSLFCPNCGTKLYEDEENHKFDYSLKLECHECEMTLTPYNIISTPAFNNKDELTDEYAIEQTLTTYWSRAMRYGFRLSDRIAVNIRATEFERYAEELGIEWELECPLFRQPVSKLDNENIGDVEFNHTRYEKDSGESIKQMAEGFTVSRSAHDVVHMNMTQYYFENHILGEYGDGDAFEVDWLEFQVHELVTLHKIIFESVETDVTIENEDFLNHLRMYYDLEEYSNEWIVEAYEKLNKVIDAIEDRYEERFDDYCDWYTTRNDKGLHTQEAVEEFMNAKEERNEKYIQDLKNNPPEKWKPGDKMGIEHPLIKIYNE